MISEIRNRILVLDGAMGTMLQRYGLKRGECSEEVVLKDPDTVRRIHREYLEAGADIITTNTFNATSVSLEKYGLSGRVREIAGKAAELARAEADLFGGRYVAGSIGPTSKSASIATDIEDMSRRSITFDELAQAYSEEIRGLSEGGADLLILETFFDSLNAKAAIYAAQTVAEETGRSLPIILSATLMNSGRLLSGQTLEDYFASLAYSEPLAVSLNCSFGAAAMLPYVERLSRNFPGYHTCAYPNAGLPNADGGYDQSPEEFAAGVEGFLRGGFVNIVGGCCGTTPDHIRAVAAVAHEYSPRALGAMETPSPLPTEWADVASDASFVDMAGAGAWDEAVWSVHDIVESGAAMVNVNLDGLTDDVPAAVSRLLRLMGADPVIAAVPLMVTSSSPAVIEAGLKVIPGRCAVGYSGSSAEDRAAVEMMAGRFGACVKIPVLP